MKPNRGRLAQSSDPVEAAVQKALAALQSGRQDDAYRMALRLTGKYPKHPHANQLLGMTLLAKERAAEAVAPLELAARIMPAPAVETYLAIALRKTGRRAQAITILRQAIERPPYISLAFYELGTLLYEQRDRAEAFATFERGMTVAPSNELSLALGTIFLERGQLNEATAAFARVLANVPGQPGAVHGLGCVLMARGEYHRACSKFDEAIARDASDTRAHLLLASCLFELDKPDFAMRHLRALLAASPNHIGSAFKVCVEGARGRLWLRPTAAANAFGLQGIPSKAESDLLQR